VSNDLLGALHPADYKRISGQLTSRVFGPRQRLQKRHNPLTDVYFPGTMLCSLIQVMEDGRSAEIAMVGSEGLIGVEAVFGVQASMNDATVQIAGEGQALSMSLSAFRLELARQGPFASLVRNYANGFVRSLFQSAACNALHSVDARCCRWLLHAQDRLSTDELPVTHELVAAMLGVRRSTVSVIMKSLAQDHVVSSRHRSIRIVDRNALEARACECYATVTALLSSKETTEIGDSYDAPFQSPYPAPLL
jgi:CRP-like cAMP-binding protein